MNEVLTLVQQTYSTDAYGDLVASETTREVLCKVKSVGTKDVSQAHTRGFQPEIKFVLADYLDYDGESVVIYEERRYNVLRTYRGGKELELTCSREVIDV